MLFLIPMIIFASVALAVWGLLQRKDPYVALRAQSQSRKESPRDMTPEGSLSERVFAPLARKVGNLLSRLVPQDAIRRLDRMLLMAGEPATLPALLAARGGQRRLAKPLSCAAVLPSCVTVLKLSGFLKHRRQRTPIRNTQPEAQHVALALRLFVIHEAGS